MAAPTIVHETWDHQALFREVARMKAQINVITDYVQSMGVKHDGFVDDTAAALQSRRVRIEQVEQHLRGEHDGMVALQSKMEASERWATAQDARMKQLEEGVVRVVEHHVQTQLSQGMAQTIEEHIRLMTEKMQREVAQRVVDDLGERAAAQLTHIKIQQAGVEMVVGDLRTDVAAHGMALDAMAKDGQRLHDAVKTVCEEQRTGCPCVSGRRPCKCNRPAGEGQPDPWFGAAQRAAGPQHFNMSSPANGGDQPRAGGGGPGGPPGGGDGQGPPPPAHAFEASARPPKPSGPMGEELAKVTLNSRLFEEKTAREKVYQYSGDADRTGPAWKSDIFDYFVSKLPASGPWLKWAEQSSKEITSEAMVDMERSGGIMTDGLNPVGLSHHIWAFLHHCLSGAAKQVFKSTDRQNGLDV